MPRAVEFITSEDLEFGPVPKGEYQIVITSAKEKEGKGKAGPWEGLFMSAEILGHDTAETIYPVLWHPTIDPDDPQLENARKRRMRQEIDYREVCSALGIDPETDWEPEEVIGVETWVYLTVKDDDERGAQNVVSRWIGQG